MQIIFKEVTGGNLQLLEFIELLFTKVLMQERLPAFPGIVSVLDFTVNFFMKSFHFFFHFDEIYTPGNLW